MRGEQASLATALDVLAPDVPEELHTALEPLANNEELNSLQTSGYVVHTLQTALYDGLRASDPEAAIIQS